MARKYGVPYMGSKNSIAEDIINVLPPADTFYDLFAGGCAITHCAMLSGKYKRFVVNDIDWRGVTLFRDAIAGKYHNEKRIIDREYFHANKETDAYVALCWSFGSNGRDYIYGEDIEKHKLTAQMLLMSETPRERMALYRKFMQTLIGDWEKIKKDRHTPEIQSLYRLGRVQSLEGLGRVQSLEGLGGVPPQLSVSITSYADVVIEGNAVVYCDPPYKDKRGYVDEDFNHDAFYDWLRTRDFPVYVSEYSMPDDFAFIWGVSKAVLLQGGSNNIATERLFVHERWKDIIPKHELF